MVEDKLTECLYVMRVYDRKTLKTLKKDIKAEKRMLESLSDPWFPRMCASFKDSSRFYMVSEWSEGCVSLRDAIRETKLTKAEMQFYFGSIVIGLEKLH